MADNTEFFEKKEEETEEVEKVKVGEKEFTQDEVNELVGLGERLKTFEEKQGQTIDEVTKSWGKRGERIGELKKQVEEFEAVKKVKLEETPENKLTPEQRDALVVKEAGRVGLLTKDEANKMFEDLYQNRRSGEKVLVRTKKVIRQAEKDGKPNVTLENLLEYMSNPDNPKDPQKAYNSMFETEIDSWKEKRIMGIKKQGMSTSEQSTAGSKQPEPVIPNRDNLEEMLKEHMKG